MAVVTRSDADVLDAIVARIRATGRFTAVQAVTPDGLDAAVVRPGDIALVVPGPATMRREAAYRRNLRTVTFLVVIKARARHDEQGYELTNALADEVIAALDSGSYTAYCLPELGGIDRGHFDATGRPEYLIGLTGTFAYVVSPAQPLEIAP